MGKKYDITKSSDMRRLERDLENDARSIMIERANEMLFDYNCPECDKQMKVKSGDNVCPHCGFSFGVNLEFTK